MKITYYGHSALLVETENVKVIIDPFLSGNPNSGISPANISVDAVLLTHGHSDHFGDAVEIAKQNDCPIFAVFELAEYCRMKGAQVKHMNIGGSHTYAGMTVKFTQAFHSSSIQEGDSWIYAGQPAGILLTIEGKTIFHAGDTALFSDLRLIGERNAIALAALPIGDMLTMGPDDALLAARWLRADKVIPLHYNTFPDIAQDGADFCDRLHQEGVEGFPLKAGESVEI
ncbi:metal-dependent hydrolase [Paenibacillus sp. FSL R7-0048]|uniref:metal-dependent hydrolase n=1 Tax=Paenibacillus TaxID=44249 RepID=UPI00097012E3|nr:metal-dependent hydrolase [Paenibacillus odorifer]OMC79401.1 metal-dependent hydrolase [Paenibacillus odorifer]OMD75060.1 metal-dependent hydrolase [Paenibacillus odorifer]OMD78009.1 metal-dependent hydrolase [Paenibacillus odorifer]OMD99053.1 metal-dependent hydrolase [Paenibacillus odorifer]